MFSNTNVLVIVSTCCFMDMKFNMPVMKGCKLYCLKKNLQLLLPGPRVVVYLEMGRHQNERLSCPYCTVIITLSHTDIGSWTCWEPNMLTARSTR